MAVADGKAALALVAAGAPRVDLVIADYNLPNGMNGLQLIGGLREISHREIPVIILTGDISTETLGKIARHRCAQLNKPVKLEVLTGRIRISLGAQTGGDTGASTFAGAGQRWAGPGHFRGRR